MPLSDSYAISTAQYQRDFSAEAQARLLAQFKGKPVIAQVLDAFSAEAQECYDATVAMLRLRTLAEASGINLDALGRIVGQQKEVVYNNVPVYFTPDEDALGADVGLAYVAGAADGGDAVEPDARQYLGQILCRIQKNANRFSSIPELHRQIKAVWGVDVSFVMDDEEPMCVAQVVCQYGTPAEVQQYLAQVRSDARAQLQPMVAYPATLRIKEVVEFDPPTVTVSGVITTP